MGRYLQTIAVKRHPARRGRGFTLVDVMVASLVVGASVAALVSMLYFSYRIVQRSMDTGVAYNIARQLMEGIKQTGFSYTAEAAVSSPVTAYYNAAGTKLGSNTSATRYTVTTSVVSDATISGASPVQPATTALRTVIITVTLKATGEQICRLDTYLARSGV